MSETLTGTAGDHPEFDDPPTDPIPLLRRWFDDAAENGVREPMAASLATVRDGGPSSRFVALKEVTDVGIIFATSAESPKGQDILANPKVAFNLYWPETMQQLRLVGRVEVLDDDEADRLFAARSRGARATTIVSEQSEPLWSEDELVARASELVASDDETPRPATQLGLHVVLDEVEFWLGDPDRLHRRLAYTKSESEWTSLRLQP
ncbi:MAG: pyridoxamine 5'-phosphate oxidase [Propionibacterium sp.]|nr:pyridoxamine 5'-phosphate oxidase [Propionibacterium sp.]